MLQAFKIDRGSYEGCIPFISNFGERMIRKRRVFSNDNSIREAKEKTIIDF